jgi:hypothetical protein
MKIIIPILLAITALVLVVGCAPEEIPIEEGVKAFIGGDRGLDIQFSEGAPPDTVYDKDFPFDINVRIENVGEWSIENSDDATLTIIGIEPASFGKTLSQLTKDSNVPLNGARYDPQGNVVEGTITNINFPDFQYQSEIVGTIELPIVARICYEYGTRANSKICILDDLLGTTRRTGEEPVCDPNENKKVENSGAPVQITSFRESVVGTDSVSFTFVISHIGEGTVTRMNTECSTMIADKDKIYVNIDTGLQGLRCSGIEGGGSEGYTTLFTGKRSIICTQPLSTPRGDFEKPISIELKYAYTQHMGETLRVIHVG